MSSSQLFLHGGRVNNAFREALFDAANRAGVTPNEFCITAAAEKLIAGGRCFPGVFQTNDFDMVGVASPVGNAARAA